METQTNFLNEIAQKQCNLKWVLLVKTEKKLDGNYAIICLNELTETGSVKTDKFSWINLLKDPDLTGTGTDSTTGNASSTLAGADSSNQVQLIVRQF